MSSENPKTSGVLRIKVKVLPVLSISASTCVPLLVSPSGAAFFVSSDLLNAFNNHPVGQNSQVSSYLMYKSGELDLEKPLLPFSFTSCTLLPFADAMNPGRVSSLHLLFKGKGGRMR